MLSREELEDACKQISSIERLKIISIVRSMVIDPPKYCESNQEFYERYFGNKMLSKVIEKLEEN